MTIIQILVLAIITIAFSAIIRIELEKRYNPSIGLNVLSVIIGSIIVALMFWLSFLAKSGVFTIPLW